MPPPFVLLIESDDDNRSMYAEYLRARGFRVTVAAAADDGFSKAAAVDLIVTGIRLARSFDGIELVRRLREAEPTARTPIIVLTACAFEPDRQRAVAAGCDAFLSKPCLPGQLEIEILRLLERGGPPRTAPARTHLTPRRTRRKAS